MTENKILKPLIKWSGGKQDEIDNIIDYIPEYEQYIEPFFGGGALYFYLKPKKAVINDIHPDLIKLYQEIKNKNGDKIYKFMQDHPNEEDVYYNIRSIKPKNSLEFAQQFYYLRKTCYRGMLRYNSKGGFNIPFGKYKTINYEELKNKQYENLLQNTEILNKDFNYIFSTYNSEDNFMFLDPPYDSKFTDYGYCQFDKNNQYQLFNQFQNTNNNCLMVIGKTDFISNLYKDYIEDEYQKNYRFRLHSSRITNEDIDNKHLIITNYNLN